MKKLIKMSLIASTAIFFIACGSGGGSSEPINDKQKPEQNEGVHVKGKVVDGYISGATVFFDKDFNSVQSADEPSDVTDGQGNFSISFKDIKQIPTGSAFVVKAGGTDIDTNKAIKQSFAFTTPHGVSLENLAKQNIIITPISSILHNMGLGIFRGDIKDFTMSNFQQKVLSVLNVDIKDIAKDPLTQDDLSLYVANLSVQKAVQIMDVEYKEFVKIFKKDTTSLKQAIENSTLPNKDKAAQIVQIIQNQAKNINSSNRASMAKHIDEQIAKFSGQEDPHGKDPQPKPQTQKVPLKPTNDQADFTPNVNKGVIVGRVVMDGYVKGVTVFDEKKGGDGKRNFKPDSTEKQTTTDEFGRFKLELGAKPADMSFIAGASGGDVNLAFYTYKTNAGGMPSLPTTPIYITPSTSIIAYGIFPAMGKGRMMTFLPNMLKAMNLTADDLAKNPLTSAKVFRINQQIQKSIQITNSTYEVFADLFFGENSIKEAIGSSSLANKDKAIKLIKFYENLSDDELISNGSNIVKNVNKAIADKTYNFSKE